LNKVLVACAVDTRASQGTDNSGRDGVPEPERITDRKYEIPDSNNFRIAYGHFSKPTGVDLEYCYIGGGVGAHNFRIQNLSAYQRNLDFVRIFNDVMVGQDVATLGIDNDTRTGTGNFTWSTIAIRNAEEAAKCVVTERRVLSHRLTDPDIYHGGCYTLDKRCQAWQRFVVDLCGQGGRGSRAA